MTPRLKSFVKRLAGSHVGAVRSLYSRVGERSWSQEGEDRVLWRYFAYRRDGFYVDVGAHHPYRFSNTCLLHRAGWRGINIDAMPGSMKEFRRHRTDDINLEIGVSEASGNATFHLFDEPALNTFDDAVAAAHAAAGRASREVNVPLRPLREILHDYRREGPIDLLTVDAEGHDLQVLRSNDWQRFRPEVVLAESLGRTVNDLAADPCAQFMQAVNYAVFAKTVNTVMYVNNFGVAPA